MTTTPPADRWPDPFATNTTDDHDPWAVEPAPTPAKRTPAPHQHDYTETTSPRGLALGYPSRPVCRTCGHVQTQPPTPTDCDHEHHHLEVRHPDTLHRRRYVEICDDCTAQLREVDA